MALIATHYTPSVINTFRSDNFDDNFKPVLLNFFEKITELNFWRSNFQQVIIGLANV